MAELIRQMERLMVLPQQIQDATETILGAQVMNFVFILFTLGIAWLAASRARKSEAASVKVLTELNVIKEAMRITGGLRDGQA